LEEHKYCCHKTEKRVQDTNKRLPGKDLEQELQLNPTISHLKRNHALGLNFLKGVAAYIHSALLAGIGHNLKLRFNQIKNQIIFWLNKLFSFYPENTILIFVEIKKTLFKG
jgi:hypothetical protein